MTKYFKLNTPVEEVASYLDSHIGEKATLEVGIVGNDNIMHCSVWRDKKDKEGVYHRVAQHI